MSISTGPPYRFAFTFLLLVAAGCSTAAARSLPQVPVAEAVREVPLEPYLGRLHTVDVEVAGRPLPFLFDTAGGVTLVTPTVAAVAGCVPFGRAVGFRHDGRSLALERCRGLDLAVGGRPTREDEVAVWDLMAMLPGAPEVGGIVGLPSFEGETITIDLAADRLIVETPATLAARLDGAEPLTVRAARQGGGAALDLFVAIDSAAGPLWFELDSGALSPVLLAPHSIALLGLDLPPGETREVELTIGGLGTVVVEAREKTELIYDGLLNAAFLERYAVTLDLERMRAWARASATTGGER